MHIFPKLSPMNAPTLFQRRGFQRRGFQRTGFQRTVIAAILAIPALLAACAAGPNSMYAWEGYQDNVDAYFRGDQSGPDAQAQSMEADLEKIRGNGGLVPPGFHAHLGLLYGQQGRLEQFAQQLQAEKNQYPESAEFMDFLLRNFSTKAKAQ